MNQLKESGTTSILSLDYKLAGLLCYVPFFLVNVAFAILWLATEPQSNRTLRFHAVQSLVLCGAAMLLGVVISMLAAILLPFGGWQIVQGLYSLDTMALVAASIIGMVNAYKGVEYRFPYIGEVVDKLLS
jgi:uncharacterized membrane protein